MKASVQHAMRLAALGVGFVVLLISMAPAVSEAELINYFGTALPGWSGVTQLAAAGAPDVNVDYAVYPPDAFDATFGGGDPSNGSKYVYAYQLVTEQANLEPITLFTVGLDPGAGAAAIGEIADPQEPGASGATVATSFAFAGAAPNYTSAVWNYNGTSIPASGEGEILIYTSPYTPTWITATIKGTSALPETGMAPSPVPEPGTLLGLAVAGLSFVFARFVRSYHGARNASPQRR
jgi:hypothetical protein